MNDQEFLKLLNAVAKKAKSFGNDYAEITAMSDKLADSGLDSLDMLLANAYMCDAFKIDDEVAKAFHAITAQEMYDFLMQHKQFTPESADAALAEIA